MTVLQKRGNMKFQLEFHPNPDCMTVHVAKQLTEKAIEMWMDGTDLDRNDEIHSPAPAYVKEIYALDGVTDHISLKRYKLGVSKGKLFSWDDLAPKIVAIMQSYLEPEGTAEMVGQAIMPTIADMVEVRRMQLEPMDFD
jgi:hypothetical protein